MADGIGGAVFWVLGGYLVVRGVAGLARVLRRPGHRRRELLHHAAVIPLGGLFLAVQAASWRVAGTWKTEPLVDDLFLGGMTLREFMGILWIIACACMTAVGMVGLVREIRRPDNRRAKLRHHAAWIAAGVLPLAVQAATWRAPGAWQTELIAATVQWGGIILWLRALWVAGG